MERSGVAARAGPHFPALTCVPPVLGGCSQVMVPLGFWAAKGACKEVITILPRISPGGEGECGRVRAAVSAAGPCGL